MSVVVATRDRPEAVARLLRSLAGQTLDIERFEVVIVDDGSAAQAAESVRQIVAGSDLSVRLVRRVRSGGPARARNEGWRITRGRLIAFTDDDCEATPAWLEAGIAAAGERNDVVVQGAVHPKPEHLDREGPFTRTHRIEPPTPWFETGSIFYPRSLLEQLDGFDESFEAAGEDTDLGWRALSFGAEHVTASEAVVFHPVDQLGLGGKLRMALHDTDAVLAFKRHPQLRQRALRYRFFWKESHALMALAGAGLTVAPRCRPATALAVPYVLDLLRRTRAHHAGLSFAPYLLVVDLLEVFTAARGAVRYRILFL